MSELFRLRMRSLSGDDWYLLPDPNNTGKGCDWPGHIPREARPVRVPSCTRAPKASCGTWHRFEVDQSLASDERCFVQFAGADYFAEVWLNGNWLGSKESAMLPFGFDTTGALCPGDNLLAVRVIDACYDWAIDGFRLGEVPGG